MWQRWLSLDATEMELDGHACLKTMCFYWLWDGLLFISVVTDKIVSWLEIGSVHSTRHCHCHRRNPYIFSVLLRHTDARRSKLKKGNLHKFLLLRPLKNIWRTFWFPAWSRELLCTNHTGCWLFHSLKATTRISFSQWIPSTSFPLKQMQWCRNLPMGLQSMTVYSNCLDHFHDKIAAWQAIATSKIYLALDY